MWGREESFWVTLDPVPDAQQVALLEKQEPLTGDTFYVATEQVEVMSPLGGGCGKKARGWTW